MVGINIANRGSLIRALALKDILIFADLDGRILEQSRPEAETVITGLAHQIANRDILLDEGLRRAVLINREIIAARDPILASERLISRAILEPVADHIALTIGAVIGRIAIDHGDRRFARAFDRAHVIGHRRLVVGARSTLAGGDHMCLEIIEGMKFDIDEIILRGNAVRIRSGLFQKLRRGRGIR